MAIKDFIEQRNLLRVSKKFPLTFYYLSEYPNLLVYQQLLFSVNEIALSQNKHIEFLKFHLEDIKLTVLDAITSIESKVSVIRDQISFLSRKVLEPEARYGLASILMINIVEGEYLNMVYSETDDGIIFENAINTYNVKVVAKDVSGKVKVHSMHSKFQIGVS